MTVQLWLNSASIVIAGLALASAWVKSMREARAQLLVDIGGEFRKAWRERWRHLPAAVDALHGEASLLDREQYDALMEAMNWLDWLGVACRRGVVTRHDFIYETIGPAIQALLTAGDGEIKKKPNQWTGIKYLSEDLDDFLKREPRGPSLRARLGRLGRVVRFRSRHVDGRAQAHTPSTSTTPGNPS